MMFVAVRVEHVTPQEPQGQPEWQPDALPRRAVLIKEVERPADTLADLDRHYGPEYAKNLY